MAKRERLQFWLVWLALGVLPLFLRPLWEPDEARYAEIPREMLASGDWLTPRLNHVLYFEKPPFQYWLSAGSMRLLGVSAGAAKLPLVLASLATLWAAGRLARRLGAASPVWASFMAASGLLGYVCGQALTLDALFSALWMVAVTALVEAVHVRLDRGQDLPWILLGHGSLALAMLTKGLLAPVLVAGAVAVSLAFAWREEPLRRAVLRSAFHPLGLLVLFGVSVPWFVLVEQTNPGHAHFYFIHEHLERFTTHVHHRQGSTNPILDKLYFFGVLAGGLLPWVSASMVGLARSLRFLRPRDPRPSDTTAPARWTAGLLLAAIGVPLLFFTFSGSKLPTYILPTVVPFAALAAAFETSHGVVGATLRRAGWELALLGTLVLVMLLGRRRDYPDGAIMPNNLTLTLTGAGLLWFGWFGFNAASTFAATDLRFAVVATNTAIAAAFGAAGTVITCPHLHFTFLPASSGLNGYDFPQDEHLIACAMAARKVPLAGASGKPGAVRAAAGHSPMILTSTRFLRRPSNSA